MMSPYNSKTGAKNKDTRTYRMQTMTACKAGAAGTNLLCSNTKQSSKNKFELPLLNNRSNSKPALSSVRPTLKESQSTKQMQVTSNQLTSSHNFLPSKIATSITSQPLQKPGASSQANAGRMYQTCKDGSDAGVLGSIGANQLGPGQPKVTNSHKSPGKSFKNGRNTASASQITTLIGSGVRKQQFVKM